LKSLLRKKATLKQRAKFSRLYQSLVTWRDKRKFMHLLRKNWRMKLKRNLANMMKTMLMKDYRRSTAVLVKELSES